MNYVLESRLCYIVYICFIVQVIDFYTHRLIVTHRYILNVGMNSKHQKLVFLIFNQKLVSPKEYHFSLHVTVSSFNFTVFTFYFLHNLFNLNKLYFLYIFMLPYR